MQSIQIRVGNTLFQFISKTKLGADFMVFQMMRNKATKPMIESMVKSQQIELSTIINN